MFSSLVQYVHSFKFEQVSDHRSVDDLRPSRSKVPWSSYASDDRPSAALLHGPAGYRPADDDHPDFARKSETTTSDLRYMSVR